MERRAKGPKGRKRKCKAVLTPQSGKDFEVLKQQYSKREGFHFELTLDLSHSTKNISERENRLQGLSCSKINMKLDL